MVRLRYVGDGEHYVIGVPMADHEVATVEDAERLVETGLYQIAELEEPVAPDQVDEVHDVVQEDDMADAEGVEPEGKHA